MAMQRRFPVDFQLAFPAGAFLVGSVEPVTDFNAPQRADGSRPQQLDKDAGLPLWQFQIIDGDAEASKKERTASIKVAAPHQPVPPSNETGLPFTPIELVGLTAMPYVDDNGNGRPRIAWSFRADGMCAPGKAPKHGNNEMKAA